MMITIDGTRTTEVAIRSQIVISPYPVVIILKDNDTMDSNFTECSLTYGCVVAAKIQAL
jgi:hypothetical protein